MRDKRSVKGGDCCNRECNWQSTRIAGLCEFIVRAWLLRIFRLARHERVGRGDIQGWGRDFGAGWRKVISDTAGHLGAEAKLIGQKERPELVGPFQVSPAGYHRYYEHSLSQYLVLYDSVTCPLSNLSLFCVSP